MKTRLYRKTSLSGWMVAVVVASLMALSLIPDMVLAKRGGEDRARFYGIVQSMPEQGLHGNWVIGGRTISTAPQTEFDQREGALGVGVCAKVDFRGGRVHEIDSEPMRNCL